MPERSTDADGGIDKTCRHCQEAVEAGTAIVICPACGSIHHQQCWSEHGGCATAGCAHAPAAASPAASPAESERPHRGGQCPTCGYMLTPFDDVCPRCEEIKLRAATAEQSAPAAAGAGRGPSIGGLAAAAPGYGVLEVSPGAMAQAQPGIAGWNWGAFQLTLFWAAAMNRWGWFAALLIANPLTFGLFGLGASIYLGVKGNELAWESRQWLSLEQFLDTQRVWNAWGKALFIVSAVLCGLYLLAAVIMVAAGGFSG
jgi:RNA polymerase subunit RPABC4/transcription elongation factor Spt4